MTLPDVVHVDDPADDRLADFNRLTDVVLRSRHEPAKGLYIAESSTVIRRAVAAGHRPRSFLMAPKWLDSMADVIPPGVPVYVAEEPVLKEITGFHLHRGALAAMHRPPLREVSELLEGARRVVVLEDIVDHTNVGAAMRACAALGVDTVLFTPSCADPLPPGGARLDGHRVPGAVDAHRPVAGRHRDPACARLHGRGPGSRGRLGLAGRPRGRPAREARARARHRG
nr:hypothetical protein GCM10025730_07980 [Promicromonospora thailandica]